MKHKDIAAELNCSRSYISRLVRRGLPTNSVEDARRWLEKQAATKPEPSDTATLTAARLEKLKMETALLALRLQREQDNCEMLPAAGSVATVKLALRFALLALKARAEEFAESVAATTRPQEAVALLRQFACEGWITGCLGPLAQAAPEPRLAASIAAMVKNEFAGVTDEMLAGWMDSLCADEAAKRNAGVLK